MRKRLHGMSLPAAAGCLIIISACGGSGRHPGTAAPETPVSDTVVAVEERDPFRTDTVAWSDSLAVGGCLATATITGSYPTGGGSRLVDSVRTWIGERLSYGNLFSEAPAFIPTRSELADGRKLVAVAGAKLMDAARSDFKSFVEDSIKVTYEFDLRFQPLFESDSLLTYSFSGYGYMGGAHGGAVGLTQTFDRNSGVSLTYANSFLPSRRTELLELIRNGLWEQYFKDNFGDAGNDGSEVSLRDALLIDPDTLPLPACPPDFRSDGVAFSYQQYEIACYAAGMPSCVISYDSLEPLMTPWVRDLLP